MNWFDVVLLAILAASVVTSFKKGLVREVIGLASVIAGLILGFWFYGTAAAWFQGVYSSRAAANLVGFLIVFFGVILLGSVVRFILGKFLKVTGLGFFDHLLGAAFGIVRGVFICVALTTGILAFAPEHQAPQAVLNSRVSPYVASASNVIVAAAPHELKDGFDKTYAQVRDAWDHAMSKKSTDTAPDADRRKK